MSTPIAPASTNPAQALLVAEHLRRLRLPVVLDRYPKVAQDAARLGRFEGTLLRHHLLLLDEVGFVPFTKAGADLLFSFLSVLHEQVSLIVTTTVPFAEWTSLFGGDQRLTAALLDRLAF